MNENRLSGMSATSHCSGGTSHVYSFPVACREGGKTDCEPLPSAPSFTSPHPSGIVPTRGSSFRQAKRRCLPRPLVNVGVIGIRPPHNLASSASPSAVSVSKSMIPEPGPICTPTLESLHLSHHWPITSSSLDAASCHLLIRGCLPALLHSAPLEHEQTIPATPCSGTTRQP